MIHRLKETHKKKTKTNKQTNFNEKNGTCCWISKLHNAQQDERQRVGGREQKDEKNEKR